MAIFWPAMHNDFVCYDDGAYVTQNVHVQNGVTWESLKWALFNPVGGNWHPVTVWSHMLDCQLYGLKPWGHHFTSVMLHAINTALVFLLLQRLTGAAWRSTWVAALFGWHPLHVESVAWVAERKDVLCASFGLLALIFYVRYAKSRGTENKEPAAGKHNRGAAFFRSPFYWLAWIFFALGLFSKPMLVTWPFVLLLLDYWPLERFQPGRWRPLVAEKIPFFVLAAVGSVATFVVQKQCGEVMTVGIFPLDMRLENAAIAYCRYLGKFLLPTDLAIFYPHPGYWPPGLVLLAGVFLLGLTVLWYVKRARHPYLLMGWFWFGGTLVPVIGLVQVSDQAMADRYSYIPSVGLGIIAVWGAFGLARGRRGLVIAWALAGLAAAASCCVLTRQQLGYWRDSENLFRHALTVTKNNYVAHNFLGMALVDRKQIDAGLAEVREALRLRPDYLVAHNNLGIALTRNGQTDEAIGEFQTAIRLQPSNPEFHNNLGNLLAMQGQTADAIREFEETIRLKPDYADAYCNLGVTLAKNHQTDAAIRRFQQALQLKPTDAEAHNNLGTLFAKNNQTDAAISEFQATIRLKPETVEAHYNLGNAFFKRGQLGDAISEYQTVTNLRPDFAPAHYYLGIALLKQGKNSEAISEFQAAVRLKPDYMEASNKLAAALATGLAPVKQ